MLALTIIICTYNRCADVLDALASIVSQEDMQPSEYEVLVVDNNSSDGTRAAVEQFIAENGTHRIQYLFEGKQGKTNALTAGIAAAGAELVLIIDSDQVLPRQYLARVVKHFREKPEIAIVGGRVLPRWSTPVPHWLSARHWSAIGMTDYGSEPLVIDATRPLCLLAPCFRISAVRQVGGFRAGLGVSGRHIGSVEDVDIINRILQTGAKGYYDPDLWLEHKAEPNRVTKRYHRRWHFGHGRFFALLRDPQLERSRFRVFGVPSHMYREAAVNAIRTITHLFGRPDEMFAREAGVWFFAGFFRQRLPKKRGDRPL